MLTRGRTNIVAIGSDIERTDRDRQVFVDVDGTREALGEGQSTRSDPDKHERVSAVVTFENLVRDASESA
jgi:hypothetical protein